ncbi:hypothetical protein PIB30_052379 [Stylosanthes scabra]|uniref:GRF-type domain-containing protein n=1 Tax=Stylosanthes scabra TaxID=79078 RepID=A0ABU6WJ76_9FABA|nr:hypothetical protein [Stylosanthes scabra]
MGNADVEVTGSTCPLRILCGTQIRHKGQKHMRFEERIIVNLISSIWEFRLSILKPIALISTVMEIDGGASSESKRDGGAAWSEQSSGTQGCFLGKSDEERDGLVAPKCYYGVYAILYKSKTSSNSNRLFFDCPFFKVSNPHCKYFLWLDKHTVKLGVDVPSRSVDVAEDANNHFSRIQLEKKVTELERRVAAMEKKKDSNLWLILVGLIVGLLAVYVNQV